MSRRRGGGRSRVPGLSELAQPSAGVPRRLRVEGDVRHTLATALSEMADPRLAAVGVMQVQMTDDLQTAKVYVRIAFGPDGEHERAGMLAALGAARGRLRRQLARQLALRHTPTLRFFYDEGPDAARRVDELLAEIRSERDE